MDIIFIEELSVFTTIGVYEWEQNIKQKLLLDIEIEFNNTNKQAAQSDQITSCLDYFQISQTVIKHIETKKFSLIEHVAQEIAEIMLNKLGINWVRVKVYKPNAIAQAKQVGVMIERTKNL